MFLNANLKIFLVIGTKYESNKICKETEVVTMLRML